MRLLGKMNQLFRRVHWHGSWAKLLRSVRHRYFSPRYSQGRFLLFGIIIFWTGCVAGMTVLIKKHLIPLIFAAPATYTWNLGVPGEYVLSNSSLLEVTGNTARLKLRQYSDDATTQLLLPLDGAVSDLATPAQTITNANVSFTSTDTYFTQAGVFNGTTSKLTAPFTDELDIGGTHTVEAWFKPTATFADNTSDYNQTILDKGNYKLYLEASTGSLTYEVADEANQNWTQKAGANLDAAQALPVANNTWDLDGKTSLYSTVKMGSYLFVSLGASTNDAEVWRCSGCDTATPSWQKIAGNSPASGVTMVGNIPLNNAEWVSDLVTDGTYLYAAMGGTTAGDAEVWRCTGCATDSINWQKVGGDTLNSSWANSTYETVNKMVRSGNDIFVGLGNTASTQDGMVWRCANCATTPVWSSIGGNSTNSSWGAATGTYEQVNSMAVADVSGTPHLVVGLGNTGDGSVSDAEVWSASLGSLPTISWTKRGGDGNGTPVQSWASTQYDQVTALLASGDDLYVGLGTTDNEAEIWYCPALTSCTATTGWQKIGEGVGASWTTSAGFNTVRSLAIDGDTLFVGLGDANGEADIYRCADCDNNGAGRTWSKIAGDGVTGIPDQSWGTLFQQASSLYVDGGVLYAGLSTTNLSAEVWRCTTTSSCNSTTGWNRVGGNYIGNSWETRNLTAAYKMASGDGKLFVGGAGGAGNALVWMFNPETNTWNVVGGVGRVSASQSTTFGWDAYTYEAIWSMIYYKGALYVGLGSSTNDAEVWRCTGCESGSPSWVRVGGDGANSSWNSAYESVSALAIYNGQLYAGLGNGTAGDAEVWRCTGCDGDTPSWGGARVGGDDANANGSATYGWNAAGKFEVSAMVVHGGYLFVGLSGTAATNAEVWRYNGSTWSTFATTGAIGGDGNNSSWNTNYERVDVLAVYDDQLYAGLGLTAGDAEVWRCAGCEGGSPSWGGAKIGGDDITGAGSFGWLDGTYERVYDMVVYNGELYAGIGLSTDEGEVWKYNGSTWSQTGGDGVANGWTAANDIDSVVSLAVANGRLFAGTGITANNDAMVWQWGNNYLVRSAPLTLNANTWHHFAAVSNGTTLKLYVDGQQSGDEETGTNTLLDSTNGLRIGMGWGTANTGGSSYALAGQLDQIRISSSARSLTDLISSPYAKQTPVTIQPAAAVLTSQVKEWNSFSANESLGTNGSLRYRVSINNGTDWLRWNGSSWVDAADSLTSGNYSSESNDETTISDNIDVLQVGTGGLLWQAVFYDEEGNDQVTLINNEPTTSAVSLSYDDDTEGPKNPTTVTAFDEESGAVELDTGDYYDYSQPSFVLPAEDAPTGATDGSYGDSGIAGYWVLFSTSNTADPQTEVAAEFITGSTFTVSDPLTTSGTYYLRVKAKDAAQNPAVSRDGVDPVVTLFTYHFDNAIPNAPVVSVSPADYASVNDFTFTWDAVVDEGGSGIAGYQYKTNAPSGTLSTWSTTITDTSVHLPDAAHATGQNYFYLKAIDTVGNESASYQIPFYFGGEGPSAVRFLHVVGNDTNTVNNFEITWDPPTTFSSDDASDLRYCYSVKVAPTELADCTMTSLTSVSGALAVDVGQNVLYVVAQDSEAVGGGINFGTAEAVYFTADTAAPGIPLNMDVADISIKSSSTWRLTVSWNPPSDLGSGLSYYRLFRSTDNVTFTLRQDLIDGTAYVDTGLTQQEYYYKVQACDDVNNCGSDSTVVSETPTGKYIEAATLTSGPTVSSITTKNATVAWTTDRAADSRVQYGTSSGNYFTSEPSKSLHETDHSVPLTNLSPGTSYYYRVKWTDEDGNTGISEEKTFTTSPAPAISDVKIKNISLDAALLEFKASGADQVKVYYGKTSGFGGVKSVSTGSTDTYTVPLEELEDGTKYYFKINALDSESAEYEGTTLDFTTLPRPEISTIRIQQVRNAAKPTVLVSWKTNTPTSSIVTYYPESDPGDSLDEVNVTLASGQHQLIIRGLLPNTPYILVVKGRDKAGNEAQSTAQRLTTATDTRPALITDLKVEGNIQTTGSNNEESLAQLVVSWTTDEPATSQVEYGEGTGTSYSQKSQEDTNLKVNHLVVLTGLSPSNVYHLRALSRDTADNLTESVDTVTITPKATDNALDLVINNLRQVFGFLQAQQ